MKKIAALSAVLTLAALLTSCRKDLQSPAVALNESSSQLLYKIVKTTTLSPSINYADIVDFKYDAAGKIVGEGDDVYYRDEKERIIKMIGPVKALNNCTRYGTLEVKYADTASGRVLYTILHVKTTDYEVIDSTVYLHDNQNRVYKILNYSSADHQTYYLDFYTLTYDDLGNIKQLTRTVENAGAPVVCSDYHFGNYDDRINPFYSNDEVRLLRMYWKYTNMSPNNLMNLENGYYNQFIYRSDGRPSSFIPGGESVAEVKYYYH